MRKSVVAVFLALGACAAGGCEDSSGVDGVSPRTTGGGSSGIVATTTGESSETTGEGATTSATPTTGGGMPTTADPVATTGAAASPNGAGTTGAETPATQTGTTSDGGAPSDAGTRLEDSGTPDMPRLDERQTLVPDVSWDCGLPEGIVPPTLGSEVFRGTLTVGDVHDVGQTQFGFRRLIEFSGGALAGPSFDGSFLEGALDWELKLATGSLEIEQVGVLRMGDGTAIYYRACGVSPSGEQPARMVADFEAPNSSDYAWLNEGTYVGVRELDAAGAALDMAFYEVGDVTPPADRVVVADPADVPHQAWECPERSGSEGDTVFSESVGIGGTIRVGESKRGARTIIPITGGSFSGRLSGEVLKGGADYQLSGDGFVLDARYTLRTDDGELILVRNCGAASALVPEFETRAEGPYSFLNQGSFLSSSPGLGLGSVNLTIYERR